MLIYSDGVAQILQQIAVVFLLLGPGRDPSLCSLSCASLSALLPGSTPHPDVVVNARM